MSISNHVARFVLAAGALLSTSALAQDRYAIWENNDEIVYVSPDDPRACTALGAAPGPTVPVTSPRLARTHGMFECAPR